MVSPSSETCLETQFSLMCVDSALMSVQDLITSVLSGSAQGHGLLTWETWKVHICAPSAYYNMWQDYALGMHFLQIHHFLWGMGN